MTNEPKFSNFVKWQRDTDDGECAITFAIEENNVKEFFVLWAGGEIEGAFETFEETCEHMSLSSARPELYTNNEVNAEQFRQIVKKIF